MLFGRDHDLVRLTERVRASRFITVVGAGGIGKTELARAVAAAEGYTFVDLMEATTVLDVAQAVARAIDLPLAGSTDDAITRLLDSLAGKKILLDNFEGVIASADETVGRLLRTHDDARVLVTSRVALKLRREEVFGLGPLDQSASRALFVARAAARTRSFDDTDLDGERLFEVTGGLPLAIELCAGRAVVLSAPEILERASADLEVYKDEGADRPDRQRTLTSSIAVTWGLLSGDAKKILEDAVAFKGGFRTSAAEDIAREDIGDVLAALDESVHAGMLARSSDRRFRFLAPIRAYLEAKGAPSDAARTRHAAHFSRVSFDWAVLAEHLDAPRGLQLLEEERENLLAAASDDDENAARIAIHLQPLLRARGPRRVHQTLSRRGFKVAKSLNDRELLFGTAFVNADTEIHAGNYRRVLEIMGEVESLGTPTTEDPASAVYWYVRGKVLLARAHLYLRELDEAERAIAAANAVLEDDERAARFPPLLPLIDGERASVLVLRGQPLDAEAILERVLREASHSGDLKTALQAAAHLSTTQAWRGDYVRAKRAIDRARSLAEQTGERAMRVELEIAGAEVCAAEGAIDEGLAAIERAQSLATSSGITTVDRRGLAVEGLLRTLRGELDDGARALASAADAFATHVGSEHYAGLVRSFCALALARAGLLRRAERAMERATDERGAFDPFGIATLIADVLPAARSRVLRMDDPERADEVLRRARAALEGYVPDDTQRTTRVFVDVATRLCVHLISSADPAKALQVRDDGREVLRLGQEPIALDGRAPPRRVFVQLVETHRGRPGAWTSTTALFDAGWPGELAQDRAARNRVQQAISTLRKAGLRDVIEHARGSYRLQEDVVVEILP